MAPPASPGHHTQLLRQLALSPRVMDHLRGDRSVHGRAASAIPPTPTLIVASISGGAVFVGLRVGPTFKGPPTWLTAKLLIAGRFDVKLMRDVREVSADGCRRRANTDHLPAVETDHPAGPWLGLSSWGGSGVLGVEDRAEIRRSPRPADCPGRVQAGPGSVPGG